MLYYIQIVQIDWDFRGGSPPTPKMKGKFKFWTPFHLRIGGGEEVVAYIFMLVLLTRGLPKMYIDGKNRVGEKL